MIDDLKFKNFRLKNKTGLVIFALNDFNQEKKLNKKISLKRLQLYPEESLILKLCD
jgi:uncharacterized protein (DUF2252 family)